jgi:hypothetical protein
MLTGLVETVKQSIPLLINALWIAASLRDSQRRVNQSFFTGYSVVIIKVMMLCSRPDKNADGI